MLNRLKLSFKIQEKNLTQKQLASILGMSENTFSNKMHGRGCFDIGQIDAICHVLGIVCGEEKAEIFLSEPSHFRDEHLSHKPA